MISPLEFLLSLGFRGLVSLSPLWVLSEYFSLCTYPPLPPTFSYILESSSGVLLSINGQFQCKVGLKLSCMYINVLRGSVFCSPLQIF